MHVDTVIGLGKCICKMQNAKKEKQLCSLAQLANVLFKKQSAAYLQRKMQPDPRQSGELRTQRDPPLRTTSFANCLLLRKLAQSVHYKKMTS